jgi:hypothetical protein
LCRFNLHAIAANVAVFLTLERYDKGDGAVYSINRSY